MRRRPRAPTPGHVQPDPDLASLVDATLQACDRSDFAVLREVGARAANAARTAGDEARLTATLGALSLGAYRSNDMVRATQYAAEVHAVASRSACPAARTEGGAALARILWSSGDLEGALATLETALGDCGDPRVPPRAVVHVKNLLGLVHAELGEVQASLDFHERALAAAQRGAIGDLEFMALTNLAGRWLAIGQHHADNGRQREALAAWERVLVLQARCEVLVAAHGLEAGWAHMLVHVASALLLLGREADATTVLAQHRAVAEQHPDRSSLPHAALLVARHRFRRGEPEVALAALADGLAQAKASGARAREADLHELACDVHESLSQWREALTHHRRFHALRESCAVERAQLRSTVLRVRLQTERALREAAAQRERASSLEAANLGLLEQAERLSNEARVDVLTGLHNRRSLEDRMPSEWVAARDAGRELFVALVDVDHFKRINDTHGHAVGDAVLRHLGAILRSHCRQGELAARYGGEEFVFVLPGASHEAAVHACERLRRAVADTDWAGLKPGLVVTASFGLANVAAADSFEAGLVRADQALYRAKAEGRNRTCVD